MSLYFTLVPPLIQDSLPGVLAFSYNLFAKMEVLVPDHLLFKGIGDSVCKEIWI